MKHLYSGLVNCQRSWPGRGKRWTPCAASGIPCSTETTNPAVPSTRFRRHSHYPLVALAVAGLRRALTAKKVGGDPPCHPAGPAQVSFPMAASDLRAAGLTPDLIARYCEDSNLLLSTRSLCVSYTRRES